MEVGCLLNIGLQPEIHVLFMMYFLGEDRAVIEKTISRFINAFLCLTLPSIIIFVAFTLNIDMPYSLIQLGCRELFYRNYFGLAIFGDYQVFDLGYFTLARLCGVFEEPGMLGTITAMLLVANHILFPKRVKTSFLLILLVILSMSMAFYLFLALLICSSVFKKNLKQLLFLALIGLSMVQFSPPEIKETFNDLVFARFLIADDGGFAGDTRRIEFKDRYAEYWDDSSFIDLAFGHGAKSNQRDEEGQLSSYQGIIYESGYVGLMFVMAFVVLIFILLPIKYKCYDILILTIFPVLSLYQRPDPLLPYFQIVYAAVVLHLQSKKVMPDDGRASIEQASTT